MRVLVVGCGSIGRRHVRNLLDRDDVEAVVVCTSMPDCAQNLSEDDRLTVVHDLGAAEADLAIVANETARHVETAVALVDRGIDVLVEKPLGPSAEDAGSLRDAASRGDASVHVGYNLRFLGALRLAKEALQDGRIGRPLFARIEAGQHLAAWRPERDYRDSYSAARERGGGVALDLSHEVDYMRWFFGEPVAHHLVAYRTGELEIETDDVFEGIYGFEGGLVVSLHLDYLEKTRRRCLRVVGSRGTLECDIVSGRLVIDEGETRQVFDDETLFDMAGTYVDELDAFLVGEARTSAPLATLEDGVRVLELVVSDDV